LVVDVKCVIQDIVVFLLMGGLWQQFENALLPRTVQRTSKWANLGHFQVRPNKIIVTMVF